MNPPARPSLLEAIARLLPGNASKAAKALVPLVAALVGVAVQVLSTGKFDTGAEATAITGAAMSSLTYLVPNVAAQVTPLQKLWQELIQDRLNELARVVRGTSAAPTAPPPPATPAPNSMAAWVARANGARSLEDAQDWADANGVHLDGLGLPPEHAAALAHVVQQLRAAPDGAVVGVTPVGNSGNVGATVVVPPPDADPEPAPPRFPLPSSALAGAAVQLLAGDVAQSTAVFTLDDPAQPVAAGSLPRDTPIRLADVAPGA